MTPHATPKHTYMQFFKNLYRLLNPVVLLLVFEKNVDTNIYMYYSKSISNEMQPYNQSENTPNNQGLIMTKDARGHMQAYMQKW